MVRVNGKIMGGEVVNGKVKVTTPHVKDIAALNAACADITDQMEKLGSIGISECAEIIMKKTEVVKTIDAHFPGAMSSAQLLSKVSTVIERRGYTDDNTLFAQSVCPDEINHEEGDVTDLFTKYLGEVFHLGGLAGVPFTGKTGFGAFSHHVPNDGHCFVLMAPHIGLDEAGNLGKYTRDGQGGGSGAACGAAVGALSHCCAGRPLPDLTDISEDYQMAYLMHEISKVSNVIMGAVNNNSMQAELARQTHHISKTMLDKIVNTDFGGKTSTLVVLTGIQINMPRPFDDYFQPLEFYIMEKHGGMVDLFDETFGPKEHLVSASRSVANTA